MATSGHVLRPYAAPCCHSLALPSLRPATGSKRECRHNWLSRLEFCRTQESSSRSQKSTLREERAGRAPLFSKTGRLLPIEVLESVLQGCFGCDDHTSRFRHQLRIRIQRSDSEARKLRCLLACEYLVTPRDLQDDGLGSLRSCRPRP